MDQQQLLGHLAGVRHYGRPGESLGTQHYFAIADSLVIFKDDPLLHRPGDKYLYSTFGYSVLGCAIEGASGQTYAAFTQEHVMKPAGMTHTAIDELYLILPNRARGYQLLTAEGFKRLPPAAQAIAKPNEIYNAPLHDTTEGAGRGMGHDRGGHGSLRRCADERTDRQAADSRADVDEPQDLGW
jgi:CubicO group peptidase (beta-lactamase class C family)